jgi:hypothetical protein
MHVQAGREPLRLFERRVRRWLLRWGLHVRYGDLFLGAATAADPDGGDPSKRSSGRAGRAPRRRTNDGEQHRRGPDHGRQGDG